MMKKILNSKSLNIVLIVLSVLAVIKTLFADYNLDEEYQVVMAYRNAMGDRLFVDMWEPHQLSAFFCTALIKLYVMLTRTTTGIVVYLRVCGTLFHLLISYYVFRFFEDEMRHPYAAMLGLIYFNTIPKMIVLPEFGIMQLWFLTLLWIYFQKAVLKPDMYIRYMILSGLALCMVVLCYPSCVLIYFVMLVLIFRAYRADCDGRLKKSIVAFSVTCVVFGVAFILYVMRGFSFSEFVNLVAHVLGGDMTHSATVNIGGEMKLVSNLREFGQGMRSILMVACAAALIALFVHLARRGREEDNYFRNFWVAFILCSLLVPLYYWFILDVGYEYLHIHLPVVLLAVFYFAGKRYKEAPDAERRMLESGLWLGLSGFACVMLITDLTLLVSLPHLMLASFAALCCISWRLDKQETTLKPGWVILVCWCLVCVIGKGYTVRSGSEYRNVFDTRGIVRSGPAIGTVGSYMRCHMLNCNQEDFDEYVRDGDSVLIVIGTWWTDMTTLYMTKDVDIAHYSVVDPAAYDERLLEYWEMYPDKAPDVIALECWFGTPYIDTESYIYKYIEEQYGYTEVYDGSYLRFYRK